MPTTAPPSEMGGWSRSGGVEGHSAKKRFGFLTLVGETRVLAEVCPLTAHLKPTTEFLPFSVGHRQDRVSEALAHGVMLRLFKDVQPVFCRPMKALENPFHEGFRLIDVAHDSPTWVRGCGRSLPRLPARATVKNMHHLAGWPGFSESQLGNIAVHSLRFIRPRPWPTWEAEKEGMRRISSDCTRTSRLGARPLEEMRPQTRNRDRASRGFESLLRHCRHPDDEGPPGEFPGGPFSFGVESVTTLVPRAPPPGPADPPAARSALPVPKPYVYMDWFRAMWRTAPRRRSTSPGML